MGLPDELFVCLDKLIMNNEHLMNSFLVVLNKVGITLHELFHEMLESEQRSTGRTVVLDLQRKGWQY